jgi:tetratricopeptide (TPR) repeat protein
MFNFKKSGWNIVYLIILFPLLNIIIHLLLPEYGLHRDEFYYIAIGDAHTFSNWDMLPVSPLFLRLITFLFGYSIKSVHLASSILGSVSMLFALLIAKELGGKKYSIVLTGSFLLVSLLYAFSSMYIYDDPLIALELAALYVFILIVKYDNQKYWLLFGLLIGLGFLTKISIVYFAFTFYAGLLISPKRKYYLNKWFWIGIVIISLFTFPFLIWQYQHHWYYLDFAKGYEGSGKIYSNIFEALMNLIVTFNIFNSPVWITGVVLLLFSKKLKDYISLGLMFVLYLMIYLFFQAQFYFLVPLLILALAAGTIALEEFIENRITSFGFKNVVKTGIPACYVIISIPFLAFLAPLVPVEKYIELTESLGINMHIKTSTTKVTNLPQHFADRLGWEEFASQISYLYNNLPDSTKKDCGILMTSWGDGSALHYYKQKYNYPEPIITVGYQSYSPVKSGQIKSKYIIYGISKADLRPLFNRVTILDTFRHPYCISYRNNQPIMLCEGFRFDIAQYLKIINWPDDKFLDIVNKEGIIKAKEYFYSERSKNPGIALFTENQMNNIAYRYLRANKIAEAFEAFKFNIEIFPDSYNVYDSIGEAYFDNHEYNLAIQNYKKSLEVNPKNKNAENMLKKISSQIPS